MKVALQIKLLPGAPLLTRIGAWLTRLVQKGEYGDITHAEAILEENPDGTYTLGSSTMKTGVRIACGVMLAPGCWEIVDVPQWDARQSLAWFRAHEGEPYDKRGAWATVMPGHAEGGCWFCDAAILASVGWRTPSVFHTAHFAAIAYSLAAMGLASRDA